MRRTPGVGHAIALPSGVCVMRIDRSQSPYRFIRSFLLARGLAGQTALLGCPLARPGLIDRRSGEAAIHAPQPVTYCVHVIHEIAQHGVLLLEHLVLLHQGHSQQGQGKVDFLIHNVLHEQCADRRACRWRSCEVYERDADSVGGQCDGATAKMERLA